jgi:hypothetical protein
MTALKNGVLIPVYRKLGVEARWQRGLLRHDAGAIS